MSLTPIFLCIKIISYIMDIKNEITLKLSIMFEFNLIQGLCFNNTRTNMWHMTQKFYKTIQWSKTLVFASKFRVMNLVLSYGASYEWTFFCFHFFILPRVVVRKLAFGEWQQKITLPCPCFLAMNIVLRLWAITRNVKGIP